MSQGATHGKGVWEKPATFPVQRREVGRRAHKGSSRTFPDAPKARVEKVAKTETPLLPGKKKVARGQPLQGNQSAAKQVSLPRGVNLRGKNVLGVNRDQASKKDTTDRGMGKSSSWSFEGRTDGLTGKRVHYQAGSTRRTRKRHVRKAIKRKKAGDKKGN